MHRVDFQFDCSMDCHQYDQLVLENNCVQFGNEYYIQNIATAMGSSMAPFYASLFIGIFENHLSNKQFWRPDVQLRFLDDIEGLKQPGEGLVIGLKYKRPSKPIQQRATKVKKQQKISPLFKKLEMLGEGNQVHEVPFVIETNGEKNVVIG